MYNNSVTPCVFAFWLDFNSPFGPAGRASIPFQDREQQTASQPKPEATGQATQDLLAIIRNTKLQQSDPAHVTKAIKQLGARKCPEAVDDLTELLTFRPPDPSEKYGYVSGSLHDPFPAVAALFEIGKPALPSLVKVVQKTETGSTGNDNAWQTISLIFRDDLPKGVEYLKEEAAKADSPEGRERVLKAAENIKKYIR